MVNRKRKSKGTSRRRGAPPERVPGESTAVRRTRLALIAVHVVEWIWRLVDDVLNQR